MKDHSNVREAGVMLIIKDGLILGISRRNDKTKFGLPGGKAELGEAPMQAAIRETKEETGVIVKDCVLIYKRVEPAHGPGGYDFYSYCYYATDWYGEPSSSEEGKVKWLSERELTHVDSAAFKEYNTNTLKVFKTMFPDISFFYEGV